MPDVLGGYQPDTKAPSARRADFDLRRRTTGLQERVDELERIVAILATVATVSTYISFSFNAGTTEPPVGNQVRLNNASQLAATRMWVSHSTFDGLDATVGLTRIKPGDLVYLQDFDDATKWVRYTITSTTNDGSYHDYGVTYLAGPGTVPFQKIALRVIFPGIGT
jgi:hypothetical protein